MNTRIFATLTFIAVFAQAYGDVYPIDPRPLRMLITESQFIITGRVTDIKEVEEKHGKEKSWSTYAVISLMEVFDRKRD